MEVFDYWNIVLADHQYPCSLSEMESETVLFINKAMENLLGIETNETVGSVKFHELLKNDTGVSPVFDWETKKAYKEKIYNKALNLTFNLTVAKMPVKGKNYLFAKYEPTENMNASDIRFEEAMVTCVNILQKPQEEIIPSFMQLLSDFYGSHSAFINRVDAKKREMVCEFEWCSNPVFQEEINGIVTQNQDILFQWMEEKNELGILEADDTRENQSLLAKQVLELFSMENITIHLIENEKNVVTAVVGLNNRAKGFLDYRLLKTVTSFVEQGIQSEAMETTLEKLKNTDSLTGFFSRNAYSIKVEELATTLPKTMGVVFINVNGLKEVNENLGYHHGDKHIKLSAQQVKNHFNYEFYRVSGDEFVGIASNIDKETFEKEITTLQEKMKSDEDYSFALGYAWGSGSYRFTSLVQESDTVMYINKQNYYHSSKRHFKNVGDTTLSDLLSYLADDEFMVYLQPQVRLKDATLYGAEALIRRFDKKNQKMVFPDQFISIYEKKSVIRHVDIFVVETVCKLLQEWNALGKIIPISVNLSRVTLLEHGIVSTIVEICDKYKIPHEFLVIEVTERVGLIENNVASTLIQSFKDNGFNISLDDFGCAYSNIVTLAQIQVDEVKIDKSLVDNLTTSKSNHILVKNVLTMCNELDGASTLAEGIEDASQAQLLHELGCHFGQGYFYSRPIPVDEFEKKYIHNQEGEIKL